MRALTGYAVGGGMVLFALLCVATDARAEYPFSKAEQAQLLERAAALYVKWPKDRALPKPGLRWVSPEWFAISRGMTERASWGTVEGGDVILNEGLLRNEFLNQEPVRSSLLVHENVHILQRDLFGPVTTCEELALREAEAYAVQMAYLRAEGRPLILEMDAAPCRE